MSEEKSVSHPDSHRPQCYTGVAGVHGVHPSSRVRGEDVVYNGAAAHYWCPHDSANGCRAEFFTEHLLSNDLHYCTEVKLTN